jgi:hypothetical protein
MAQSQDAPSFEDLDTVTVEEENGSDWIDPDPGSEVGGTITGFNPLNGRNGVVEIDGRPMYITASIRRELIAALVEGCQIVVRVEDTQSSFENDDGETVTYYEKEAAFGR